MGQSYFDPGRYKWREVTGEPGLSYKVGHDYTILGYDLAAGTLDMLVRFPANWQKVCGSLDINMWITWKILNPQLHT